MSALVMVAAACIGSPCSREYPLEHEAFLELPRDQRKAALEQHPPEEQVDLYVSAMLVKHPPDLELADAVAANGTRVLPLLIERLQAEKREVVQVDLLYVLLRMQQMGEADVAGDAETMATLEGVVSAMKDPAWKREASDFVNRIRAGS